MKQHFISRLACVLFALALGAACPQIAYSTTEDVQNQSFNVKPEGLVKLDLDHGNIIVVAWAEPRVDITVTRSATAGSESAERDLLAADKLEFGQDGDTVSVRLEVPERLLWRNVRRSCTVEIKAPADMRFDLRTSGGNIGANGVSRAFEARTSGGNLVMSNMGGQVNVRTSGGTVKLEDCHGGVEARTSGGSMQSINGSGSLNMRTSGGSIMVDEHDGDVQLRTSGGHLEISGVTGRIQGRTSGGHIELEFDRQPGGDCSVETSAGHISLSLPEDAKANLDAKTSVGRVSTEIPIEVSGKPDPNEVKGVINGGGPLLMLRTSAGSIKIKKS